MKPKAFIVGVIIGFVLTITVYFLTGCGDETSCHITGEPCNTHDDCCSPYRCVLTVDMDSDSIDTATCKDKE